MDYTAEAQEKLAADMFATKQAGAVIEEVRPGYARCTMSVTPEHLNANGAVMGGAIFTLADYAFAAASNVDGMNTVAVTSSIEYMRAGKGEGVLTAEAQCRKNGRSFGFYEITVSDDTGREVAVVTTTGFRKDGTRA